MRATVVEIASGSTFIDKQQRVTLQFEGGDTMLNRVRFPLNKLELNGLGSGPHLDQDVEVTLSIPKVKK